MLVSASLSNRFQKVEWSSTWISNSPYPVPLPLVWTYFIHKWIWQGKNATSAISKYLYLYLHTRWRHAWTTTSCTFTFLQTSREVKGGMFEPATILISWELWCWCTALTPCRVLLWAAANNTNRRCMLSLFSHASLLTGHRLSTVLGQMKVRCELVTWEVLVRFECDVRDEGALMFLMPWVMNEWLFWPLYIIPYIIVLAYRVLRMQYVTTQYWQVHDLKPVLKPNRANKINFISIVLVWCHCELRKVP
jgi:hypothetical protein